MIRHAWVGAVVVVLAGCGLGSDGAVGSRGRVRFSHIFQFTETEGFEAPIANGATTLVELQHARAGGDEPPNAPEFTLTAKPVGHAGSAAVLPLGYARSAVRLLGVGAWRLEALDQGQVVDALAVRVAPATHLRIGREATVRTWRTSPNDVCSQVHRQTLDSLVLHPNQDVSLYVVPLDDGDVPMTGLLELSAQGRSTLDLTAPALLPASQPNMLHVEPVALDGTTETIRLSAAGLRGATVSLQTSTDRAPISCD